MSRTAPCCSPARPGRGAVALWGSKMTPSVCVPPALDRAASSLLLSCSTVVTLMSDYFVSAWKLDEGGSLKCCLLTSPYLLGHDLVTYSALDPLSRSHSPDFPLALTLCPENMDCVVPGCLLTSLVVERMIILCVTSS